jgi:aryl-alcohol dehydrogenase-like predicted oxidoreductase
MDYVPLGKTGLISSVIGLGGGSSGRFGLKKGGTKADAIRLIRAALDQGITFFDGAGLTDGVDELLAEALGTDRQDVLISTKVHLGPEPVAFSRVGLAHKASSWAARRFGRVCSARTLRKRIEQTLKTLRTDRVDVLHLHAVSALQYPLVAARLLPELIKLKKEGKLRAVGITEAFLRDPSHLMLHQSVSDERIDTIMTGFNIRNPSAEKFVIPKANEAGIGVIGMFAVRGLLEHAGQLGLLMGAAGIGSLSEFAYRYVRHQPGMDVVLTGTGDPDHLKENIAAALAPPLPVDVLERVRAFQSEGASTR